MKGGGGHSSTRRSKSQTRLLAYDLCSYSILMGLIAVSRTPPPHPRPERPFSLPFPGPTYAGPVGGAGNKGAGMRASTPQVQDAETGEIRPTYAGLRRDTSISHIDIIPMFYLSPCNSFYISGLCSLASVQSQPWDTGL